MHAQVGFTASSLAWLFVGADVLPILQGDVYYLSQRPMNIVGTLSVPWLHFLGEVMSEQLSSAAGQGPAHISDSSAGRPFCPGLEACQPDGYLMVFVVLLTTPHRQWLAYVGMAHFVDRAELASAMCEPCHASSNRNGSP